MPVGTVGAGRGLLVWRTMMAERLMTAFQLADHLRVEEGTVKKWARQGKIPRVKLGYNCIRYRMSSVVKALVAADRVTCQVGGGRS